MSDSAGSIVAALEQELLTLTAVHEALQRESAALSGGNANDIDDAIAAKNEALQAHQTEMNRRPDSECAGSSQSGSCRPFKIAWRRSPHNAKNSTAGTAR